MLMLFNQSGTFYAIDHKVMPVDHDRGEWICTWMSLFFSLKVIQEGSLRQLLFAGRPLLCGILQGFIASLVQYIFEHAEEE